MTLILSIETSSQVCSVSLHENGKEILTREETGFNVHSALLTSFIEEIVAGSGKNFSHLDALAVGKGPGSYTGLRIGVSTAKGLCYGLGIPLIGINTLKGMANGFKQNNPEIEETGDPVLFCPMIDARRMEVYSAFFNYSVEFFRETSADIIDEHSYHEILEKHRVYFFGDGAEKCKTVIPQSSRVNFVPGFFPSASFLGDLAYLAYQKKEFEDVAYFEPFYLKDFMVTPPKAK